MGREGDQAYMTGSNSRGRQLPMIFMLVAIVVATAVVAIGVVLGGSGMAVAAPGDDATIEATTFRVADGQTSEEYANCPSNKRVVGGGVVQSGSPNGLLVRASGPLDETGTTAQTRNGDIATQWYAAVGNYSNSGQTVTFKVFAICSANSDATIEATSFPVPQIQPGDASAVCPPSKRVVGGGVVQSGPPASGYVAASGPLDETGTTAQTQSGDTAKEWYAAVSSNSGAVAVEGPLPYKVFALCSANSDATIEANSFQVGDRNSGEQNGEEYAKCPTNKRALGGGVVESGPPNGLLVRASSPLDETGTTAQTQSSDIATQWYAAVSNSGLRPRYLKVFAICQ